jgi:hypothetical protein
MTETILVIGASGKFAGMMVPELRAYLRELAARPQ